MENLLVNLLSSLGLSGAAGLNAYVPLLALGLLDRAGYLQLSEGYGWLSNPWVLLAVVTLAVLDFVGDKVPGVDHVLHTLGGWVNPVAGAIVFAAQHNLLGEVDPVLASIAGFVVAGGFHASRAALRPVATATTAGAGNPAVSLVEDLTSLAMSALAIFAPLLAALVVVTLGVLLALAWRRWRGRRPARPPSR